MGYLILSDQFYLCSSGSNIYKIKSNSGQVKKKLTYKDELRLRINLGIKEFKEFQKISEKIISQESIKILRKKFENISEKSENEYSLKNNFISNIRVNLLFLCISFIEFEMKNICDAIFIEKKVLFSISDLKGNSDFEKAKIYLKNCGIIDLQKNEYWNFIDISRLIRNKFIHNQGALYNDESNYKTIKNFILQEKG